MNWIKKPMPIFEPRTTEEHKRETVYFWLKEISAAQMQYMHLVSPIEHTVWIHVTDMMCSLNEQRIDVQHLVEENILTPINVPYQLQNDWRDRFAPYAYMLTEKGRAILNNPRDWVFRGECKLE
jgi:hypothetical protein